MSKIVAIVGRPNVGKSTLFNRLVESRKAIVDDESGVTRDRHYGTTEWCGREFIIVDTGGYVTDSDDFFETAIRKQVEIAMEESDLLLFMVDVTTDITFEDEAFANVLRRSGKPVIIVANKVDNFGRIGQTHVFYSLGFDEIISVSSVNGSGTGELLDRVVELIGADEVQEEEAKIPKFAIIGRPNVGKSTLVNMLLGEERNIVSDIAGTTRDSIHTKYNKFGNEFYLIDTAGLRKKAKVDEDIEFYSVMRAIHSVEEADVCILLVDAQTGMESQDVNIFHLAQKRRKGIVILINKWDLVEKDHKTVDAYKKTIEEKIAPFVDVPMIFVSALEKTRIHKAIEIAVEVYENRKKKIPTNKINTTILPLIESHPPPSNKGKFITIKYITQLPAPAPTFGFFCNMPQYIKENYKRYLENKIRENFNFTGVPLTLVFRKK
ncbi:MAG: ribosome biogenesis GTPase Der [Bacteroidetes bacterium]|nr:ribosome biogenesis GTPase Der [Bacteroidota bacterium]